MQENYSGKLNPENSFKNTDLDRLRELAQIAHSLANDWNEKPHIEVKADDEVGDVEKALNAIAINLEIQKRRQAAQYAATKVLAESASIEAAIPGILEAVCKSLGWQWSALWTIDNETEVLHCSKIWEDPLPDLKEFSELCRNFTFSKGVGLPGRVWANGQPAWIFDVQADPNFPRVPVARKAGLHGAFCFPIRGSYTILGVMEFLSINAGEPDNSLLAMMNAIGSQIGQFIERKLAEELTVKNAEELAIMHQRLEIDLAMRMEDTVRLGAQHAATRVLADSPDLSRATPQILQAICVGLDWECAMMWEVNEKENLLSWVDGWNNGVEDFNEFEFMSRNMSFKKGTGHPGRVWQSGEPLWILDIVKDPNFPRAPAANKVGLHGAFAFPVRLQDKVLGVMEFFSRKVQEPDKELLEMMFTVGSQIGQFIERKHAEFRAQIYLKEVEKEKEKSNELLHVILPPDIVRELQVNNNVQSRRHENVAVLFCDIVGFTKYCDGKGPEEIVSKLQEVVEAFEELSEKYQVLKIKTIGDCFMAVSGLLPPVDNPVLNALKCGLEMNPIVQNICPEWSVRVGISLGPVVAGVLGRKQYQYDIWGDTVNVASRMESNGQANSVVMSQAAWKSVEDLCHCDSMGKVNVKGKGELEIFRFAYWKEDVMSFA